MMQHIIKSIIQNFKANTSDINLLKGVVIDGYKETIFITNNGAVEETRPFPVVPQQGYTKAQFQDTVGITSRLPGGSKEILFESNAMPTIKIDIETEMFEIINK